MTSAKPISVPVKPVAILWSASTAMSLAAMTAPMRFCRWMWSPANTIASPIVKNPCIWITASTRGREGKDALST
jgi:hypothetical protein